MQYSKIICDEKENQRSQNVGVRAAAGAGVVIRIYCSLEPEPKEIFTAPQHWYFLSRKVKIVFCYPKNQI